MLYNQSSHFHHPTFFGFSYSPVALTSVVSSHQRI
jgi:hypothetical protein